MAMAKQPPSSPDEWTPEERMQHEIEELEGGSGWKGVLRWVLIVVVAVGIVAGLYITGGKRPKSTPTFSSRTPTVIIETEEPPRGKLASPPSRFRWESVSGRSDYLFRVMAKGVPQPLIERVVRENAAELTPDESARLVKGGSYIWEVEARSKNGKALAAGRSFFDI